MNKEELKEQQPVVYQALNRACREHRISSAYLFSGPYGTPKYETAVLLAQSIFCEKQDGLACGTCNTCRRVAEGKYTDLIVLDGRGEKGISKEMVDALQERFSKTALEENGQRVYIIRNAENATASAQNSMLKFLEEPGRGITAILTTDNVNAILPTIISRCTVIPFLPVDPSVYYRQAMDKGFKEDQAYFVSHIVKEKEDLDAFWDEEAGRPSALYEKAAGMLEQYLNHNMKRDEISVDFERSWTSQDKDASKARKENLVVFRAFFDLLMMYGRDVIRHDAKGPSWYHEAVMKAPGKPEDYAGIIRIASEEKDLCNKFNDLNLVMYQTFFRLEEYNDEHSL